MTRQKLSCLLSMLHMHNHTCRLTSTVYRMTGVLSWLASTVAKIFTSTAAGDSVRPLILSDYSFPIKMYCSSYYFTAVILLCLHACISVSSFQHLDEYTITTDSISSNWCQNCLTLTEFALNISRYLTGNTTLVLQPGNHALRSSLLVSNVEGFTLHHVASPGNGLKCEKGSKLVFDSIQRVEVSNLNLIECFDNKIVQVNEFTVANSSFFGSYSVVGGRALEVVKSNATITNCFFTKYYYGTFRLVPIVSYKRFVTIIRRERRRIGGALLISQSNVNVSLCNFTENRAELGGAIYAENSSNVSISETALIFNTAYSSNDDSEEVAAGGVLYATHNCSITITDASFDRNEVYSGYRIGGALSLYRSNLFITGSVFTRSKAEYGGIAFLLASTAVIQHSKLNNNTALNHGAVMFSVSSSLTLLNSTVAWNYAHSASGVVYLADMSVIVIQQCTFSDNIAASMGGVMYSRKNNSVSINSSTFTNNFADYGAVFYVNNATVIETRQCDFTSNRAGYEGGVFYINEYFNTLRMNQSTFFENTAYTKGGVLYSKFNNTIYDANNRFIANRANKGAVMYLYDNQLLSRDSYMERNNITEQGIVLLVESKAQFSGESTFYRNVDSSIVAIGSVVSLLDIINFKENMQKSHANTKGGALYCVQTAITLNGTITFHNNTAFEGGAIFSIDSKIYAYGSTTISSNDAMEGGGLYLYQSELLCRESIYFIENHGNKSGGGVHSSNSFIRLTHSGSLLFMRNRARLGGALFLTSSSKITALHQGHTVSIWDLRIRLLNNSAHYGGGIFVDDETNSVSCAALSSLSNATTGDECFLQTELFFNNPGIRFEFLLVNTNKARKAGADIYGGLLDRCRPHPLYSSGEALKYLQKTSNIENLTSISSKPVRVCFCRQNHADCDFNPGIKNVTRGRNFTFQVVALDQVNNTLNATILAYSSGASGIGQGQQSQDAFTTCTTLTYRVYSKYRSETLTLYADGPCKDTGISSLSVRVRFLPCVCPVGFTESLESRSTCKCVCEHLLQPYLTSCNSSSHLLLRESTAWIGIPSDQDTKDHGYLVYAHCPFDYCFSPSTPVYINLSMNGGADAQCAFNRAGILCGACKPSFSLALGSSRCLQCSNSWLALLIPFSIMGLVLVAVLLILNLTVSTGTITSIVFFSNIVIANRAILVPLKHYNILATFLSWLSLDLGIETCFVNGLDAYSKTWLQLIFPVYIFAIIVVIIMVCHYSKKVSDLVGGRNPIATLATLIWFSNAKLFRTVVSAVSFTVLEYPNNIQVLVWFPDGNI